MSDLGMAYGMKRKKKMAKGGMVNESAKSEQRPMPSEVDKDAPVVSNNNSKKSLPQSSWSDNPTVEQAQKPSLTRLNKPKMMGSDAFSVRYRDEVDKEAMEAFKPPQPEEVLRVLKAKGGIVEDEYGMGPEQDNSVHPKNLEKSNDQMSPPKKQFMADHFAFGGSVADEIEDEHYNSVAAAIMAKKDREKRMSSGASDEPIGYAEGGQVEIEDNMMEQPNQFYKRNSAILKENYDSDFMDDDHPMDSNEKGDSREMSEENKHDMVSSIRRKMNVQRQFKAK